MIRVMVARASAVLASAALASLFVVTPAQAVTINLTGSTCTWDSGSQTLNCSNTNTPPGGPSNCSLSASTNSLPTGGGSVTLTMRCDGTETSCVWTGGFAAAQSACQAVGTVTATTSFTAIARNSSGVSSVQAGPTTVTVAGGGGGGGGGGAGPFTCQGFAATQTLTFNWNQPTRLFTSNFGANGAVVLVLPTPALNRPDAYFTIGGGDIGSNSPTSRTYVLSSQPCDFTGGGLGVGAVGTGITVTSYFTLGNNATNGYVPSLTGGLTYYLNIKNEVNGQQTCSGSCNMLFDLLKPPGL